METSIKITPAEWQLSRLQAALYVLCGSLFIAACSQVCLTLPFTLVPFTFQAQAVLVVAAVLGPELGVLAVAAWLMEGVLGAPVFAEGQSGLWRLLGSCGGYFLSYLPVSYLVGRLFQNVPDCGRLKAFLFFAIGNALVFLGGWAWLAAVVGPKMAFAMGVSPFLVTDLLKLLLVVSAFPTFKKLARCL